jgi:hypothetical protein
MTLKGMHPSRPLFPLGSFPSVLLWSISVDVNVIREHRLVDTSRHTGWQTTRDVSPLSLARSSAKA